MFDRGRQRANINQVRLSETDVGSGMEKRQQVVDPLIARSICFGVDGPLHLRRCGNHRK